MSEAILPYYPKLIKGIAKYIFRKLIVVLKDKR